MYRGQSIGSGRGAGLWSVSILFEEVNKLLKTMRNAAYRFLLLAGALLFFCAAFHSAVAATAPDVIIPASTDGAAVAEGSGAEDFTADENIPLSEAEEPQPTLESHPDLLTSYIDPNAPQVNSTYAIVIDGDTGSVLYEKNSNDRAHPASTTKIMSCIIVLENSPSLDEMVTVGSEVNGFSSANSLMGVKENETLSVRDLLYGMMLLSGNDAANALAVHVAGSIEGFASMMNAKATELGLTQTHFVNPHGLTDEQHYTTAADLAKISQYAMQNGDFRAIVAAPSYTLAATNKNSESRLIHTTNRFLSRKNEDNPYLWSAVTGIKTGSTNAAQGCLVTSASYNGMNLIAVALHDESKDYLERWEDCRKMIEYGFNNLDRLDLSTIGFAPVSVQVNDASVSDPQGGLLELRVDAGGVQISGLSAQIQPLRDNPELLTVTANVNNGLPLEAPVEEGALLGTAVIMQGNTPIANANLVATRSVASTEDDPKNIVSSLIQSVGNQDNGGGGGVLRVVLFALLLLVVAVLLILLLRYLFKQKRNRKRPPMRPHRYYDYSKRP